MVFTFACYFPAEDPIFVPVTISLDVWVAQFLETIQEKLKLRGREVILKDLRLYKVTSFVLWQTAN
jgi:hypothetical protein